MSLLYMKVYVSPGTGIIFATRDAIRLAKMLQIDIEFVVAGITLTAHPNSKPKEIYDEYQRLDYNSQIRT